MSPVQSVKYLSGMDLQPLNQYIELMIKIKHLSVVAKNPERCSVILAELSNGKSVPFRSKNMLGGYICMYGSETDELIEFLPEGYLLYPTELGANFKPANAPHGYNSTHFQMEVDVSMEHIKSVADKYKLHHCFRPRFGGPLYEVWIEDQLLVEFVSDEIRAFK